MRRLVVIVAALAAVIVSFVVAWRRNPRIGAGLMNEKVNPIMVRRGVAGVGRSEIGTLEHFGRRTGTRHLTPVHPVATAEGFRIVVPLGEQSQWARNVVAAGHCRIQLHDTVYGLDEPVLLAATAMDDLPPATRWIGGAIGTMYLRLHRFEERPGTLDDVDAAATVWVGATPVPATLEPV